MEELKGDLGLIKHAILAKCRGPVDASKISVKDVNKYFQCGRRSHEISVGTRLSYNDEEKTKVIVDAVAALSVYMQHIPQDIWSNCEKLHVQPYVHSTFLPVVLGCLDNSRLVQLERERQFELKAIDDEGEVLPVNGATDHCVKLVESDCRLFIVEDKTICKTLSKSFVAQTRSEMMVEVRDLFDFWHYQPKRYCGILHNGSQWLFIERELIDNCVHWSYVELPPIFTSPNSGIDMPNCRLVATFLEHVLKVADSIIEDVYNHRFVSTALPLLSIAEHDSNNDGNNDDDDDEDGHDDDEHVAVGANAEEKTRFTSSGAGLSGGHNHNVLTMRVSNAYYATSTGKENAYMPFTAANLSMRPTNFIKKF